MCVLDQMTLDFALCLHCASSIELATLNGDDFVLILLVPLEQLSCMRVFGEKEGGRDYKLHSGLINLFCCSHYRSSDSSYNVEK